MIIKETNYKSGKKNGLSIVYYNSDDIKSKSYFLDGEINGEELSYYTNGVLKRKSFYKDC